jgi:hypothetical protein
VPVGHLGAPHAPVSLAGHEEAFVAAVGAADCATGMLRLAGAFVPYAAAVVVYFLECDRSSLS